ncbi:Fucose 4-O-acetylase [Ruaniaceae bacterium KH17]|nr:Fucose 4-O-acetylase [Ruaniaceae bacterium KH17]
MVHRPFGTLKYTGGEGMSSKPRIALWDNARFLMLLLVVAGHMVESIRSEGLGPSWFYTFIYLFHMPVMMFIAGYFAHAEISWKAAYSVVQLLAAYLAWELIIGVVRYLLTGWTPSGHFLTTPSWAMWFLVSLASLKVLLPFVMYLRHPLAISVIISLASGAFLDIDTVFSVSRTLGFLPFFVGGYIAKVRGLLTAEWFTAPSARLRVAAGAILVAVGGVLVWVLSGGDSSAIYRWAFHRDNYWETTLSAESRIEILPVEEITESAALVVLNGVLVTALFLALAVLLGAAVLLLIPRSTSVMKGWGQNTLYIYLLHIPIMRTITHLEIVPTAFAHLGMAGFALALLISGVLACALGTRIVKRLFRPLVEPNVTWLLRAPA